VIPRQKARRAGISPSGKKTATSKSSFRYNTPPQSATVVISRSDASEERGNFLTKRPCVQINNQEAFKTNAQALLDAAGG